MGRARKAIEPDKRRYNEVWSNVSAIQSLELRSLDIMSTWVASRKQHQPYDDLAVLMSRAQPLDEWYQEVVETWATHCNAEHKRASPKSLQRSLEKVYRAYYGRVGPLTDIL